MDQGTGKTKVAIDDAAHNYREDRIDAMLVIAPNSVKTNWVMWECHKEFDDDMDAIEAHMPHDVPVTKGVWISGPDAAEKAEWKNFEKEISRLASERTRNSLVVLTVNIDALNVARCFEFLQVFVSAFRTMIVVDESTRIKNRSSKRTKAVMKLRSSCPLARILSGTPVSKRPLDSFAQFNFLDEDVLGFGNFYSFRNHYAVMGGFKDKQVLSYKNLDELADSIASCSYRITKEECLDLPPKVYNQRRVKLSAPQAKAYAQMVKDLYVEWKDDRIEAPIVLSQILRLQEIIGGYLPIIENGERVGTYELIEPKSNPKFVDVLEQLDEVGDSQVIIWCRFTAEIEGIHKLLVEKGYTAEKFHGPTSTRERLSIRKNFSRGVFKILVAMASAGGIGIDEFKAACYEIYVSNDYDTEKRVQSEDRAHRIGSEIHDAIFITDVVVPNTIDTKIIRTIRNDLTIAAQIMRDGWKTWL
jgi:SNF2 family DNA or RNA helicase